MPHVVALEEQTERLLRDRSTSCALLGGSGGCTQSSKIAASAFAHISLPPLLHQLLPIERASYAHESIGDDLSLRRTTFQNRVDNSV